jgi:hypothetical protein
VLVALTVAHVVVACGPSGSPDIRPFSQDPVGTKDAANDPVRDQSASPDVPVTPGDAPSDAGPAPPDAPALDAPVSADAGGTDEGPPKRPSGMPCAAPGDCATGFCVDGVCCATACTERCFTCNRAGAVGSCTAVPTGDDPRNECVATAVITCGSDGTCDGNGACRLFAANTECEPGGCSGTTMEKSARLCDGNGVCQAATTRGCTAATCQNGSCGSACTTSSTCLPGFFCDANVCRLKRALGDACSSGGQCASNFCVSGSCCDSACDKACYSCKVPGKPGLCSPVANGEDPGDRCAAQAMDTCGRDGLCDANGACRLWGVGVACGQASCTGSAATSGRACDGRGTCSAATRTECGAYGCDGTKCATSCSGTMGCAPGFTCSGTTCVPSGLGLRWTFEDEAASAVALDASGNGRNGTYAGPTLSTEVPTLMFPNQRSRLFDDTKDQVVQAMPMPEVFRTLTALTIAVWYKSGPPPAGGDGAELVSLADNHLLRLLQGGGFEVTKRTSDKKRNKCTVMIPTAIDNKWHHVATTIEAGSIKLYFDGVAQTCTFNPTTLPTIALGADLAGNFSVGRHGSQPPQVAYDFSGNIDEVRLYVRALTAVEVASLAAGAL